MTPESFDDEAVRSCRLDELADAVEDILRRLDAGWVDNPPRQETVGRPGDPDYFRLDLRASLRSPAGEVVLSARKLIEEAGARDASGGRRLGERTARLELVQTASGRRATLAADAVTDLRTGLAAVLSARWLAAGHDRLAIVGTGRIATQIALAADRLLSPAAIRVTSRTGERREAFRRAVGPEVRAELTVVESVEAAVAGAEVIFCAVPADTPVLDLATAGGASLVVAVEGDPRAVMLAPGLLAARPVVVDEEAQARRSGSFLAAAAVGIEPAVAGTLAAAAAGRLEGLRGAGAIAFWTGLAALDLAVGAAVWAAHGGPAK